MANQAERQRCPVATCRERKDSFDRASTVKRWWHSVESNQHLLAGLLDVQLAAMPCNVSICPNCYTRLLRSSRQPPHSSLDDLTAAALYEQHDSALSLSSLPPLPSSQTHPLPAPAAARRALSELGRLPKAKEVEVNQWIADATARLIVQSNAIMGSWSSTLITNSYIMRLPHKIWSRLRQFCNSVVFDTLDARRPLYDGSQYEFPVTQAKTSHQRNSFGPPMWSNQYGCAYEYTIRQRLIRQSFEIQNQTHSTGVRERSPHPHQFWEWAQAGTTSNERVSYGSTGRWRRVRTGPRYWLLSLRTTFQQSFYSAQH